MNRISKLALSGTTSMMIGLALAVSTTSPVYAWHPEGEITKSVQNITAKGGMQDADDAKTAVSADTSDNLLYSITIKNTAKPAGNGHNDLAFIVLKDTLPEGIELIDTPAKRTITENLGTLKPGESVTKKYLVKVTSTKDGQTIVNKACFEGDSLVKDNPQSGCDDAVIKVEVPEIPVTPVKPTTVTPTPAPAQPAVLPATGPASLLALGGAVTAIGYAGSLLALRRRG